MKDLINRVQVNWEAMSFEDRRKATIWGIAVIAVLGFIGFNYLFNKLSADDSENTDPKSEEVQVTNTKNAKYTNRPGAHFLESVERDSAAYERQELRQHIQELQNDQIEQQSGVNERFNNIDQRFDQVDSKIDRIVKSTDELSFQIAKERSMRRAQANLLAEEYKNNSQNNQVVIPSASNTVGNMGGNYGSSNDGVLRVSPFDLLTIADATGIRFEQPTNSYTYATTSVVEPVNDNQESATQEVQESESNNSSQAQSQASPEQEVNSTTLTRVPAGSIMQAVLVSGIDAPVGDTAKENPHPVIAMVTGEVKMPNGKRMDVSGCTVLLSGYGDLSTERVYFQSSVFSCISESNEITEVNIQTSALGADGKVGVKGNPVTKDGALVARSMQTGLLRGFNTGVSRAGSSIQVQTDDPNAMPSSSFIGQSMLSNGVENAMDALLKRYNRLLDMIFPVLEVHAGQKIELQVLSSFDLKVKK